MARPCLIYVDTSYLLAALFQEPIRPEPSFWRDLPLVSSTLIEDESWVRVHAYERGETHGKFLERVLQHVVLFPVSEEIRERLKSPFPTRIRTLDAIHLATAESIQSQHRKHLVVVASYDAGIQASAVALGFTLYS